MKKLSLFLQWVVVAGLAAFVGYVLFRPTPEPAYAPNTWNDWNGVTVLSYAGIARRDSPVYPSVRKLEAQLAALRDAGYRTVRPEDVRAFLDDRAPLPEKALLLIFEGGRKEAFIRATPILQRTGFSAVIAMPTTVMEQWGSFYLKRKELGRISKLPQWQVGSMGHQAVSPLPGKASDEENHFLVNRARRNGREESADEFRERVLKDYSLSAAALEKATGKAPLLYLYPFGEAGQYPGSDPLAEAANRDAVTRHFGLAFIGGSNAFNGPGSDPWTLTRLRVPGTWSPERLLAELSSSQPRTQPQAGLGAAQDWVFDREGEFQGDGLRLAAGSLAWLRGTDAWTDADVSATLQTDANGSGALYARYTGLRSWLRVSVDGQGLSVQERLGDRLYTLHRQPAPAGATQTLHRVRLRLRNNRAWVWLNEQEAAENLPLSPGTRRGRVGLGGDQGDLRVTGFDARPLPARWVLANSIRLIADADREQVQAVLPVWFRPGETPVLAQTAQQDLLTAAMGGIQTLPLLPGGAALEAEAARAWAAAIDVALSKADMRMLVPSLAVEGPAFALADELRNRHFRVTHLLSPEETMKWGRSIAQQTPDEILVVNEAGDEARQALAWLKRVIPSSRLALREPDASTLAPNCPTVRLYEAKTAH